ncbi:MAG: transcription-repair coupling factor, partial [[Eubacterium] sulci]|nr:transcription-repair coupling factor [[Eubacterium] sulci]
GKNRVVISASSDERQQTIDDFVANIGLADKIQVVQGSLSMGMVFPEEKLYIISDKDIFNSTRIGKKRHKTNRSQKMQSFSDFKTGDYVVHENHGIGKFLGIQALEVQGEQKDYLKIKYSGTDLLYVPVEQMDIVQKYIGSEGIAPKVSKLSGDEWKVAKTRAKLAIAEMTEELIKLYADRKASKGYAFSKDTVWQKEFEAYFSYQETDDQLTSIEEIKKDMESNLPMDRLLCGDVGYGKTEVAARAIFKCISEGKQAAMLVPTTILANQHYNSLKDRFSNFPFNIDMLSRFRTDKQQEKIIDGLKKGSVDFVIGTHRLLSDDIKYKDLGLLVIDEEQRFGVAHKEKLKQLKSNIDVLTLSATPIPRTLNMSLTGIKDMSLITEPPSDRYPVQTYVLEQDDIVMREIIARELDRDGQVYIVFNRVKGINRLAEKVQSLVPDAKIVVGHGQMNEKSLESVMQTFISGKADILIATTIIESGIDIPNANTMIVIDADKCGLAQLYQLRGRVGRTDKIAYAYLMYQKNKVLTEVAEKRLKAIKEFTEFGSGFKVAMRDLEIRGAGNVLGAEQSGHMMNIGYELYCKLVDDAVRKAKGESVPEQVDEINIELDVAANIPNWYIDNETLKLQMYKKIATVSTREDSEEIIDELLDRFGDLPKETLNLIAISMIRALSANVGVCNIHEQAGKVVIYFAQDNALKAYALMKASEKFGSKIFFHGGNEPFIRLSVARKERLDSIIDLLEIISDNKDIDNSGSKTVS